MKIYIALDLNCANETKMSEDKMGGTERLFWVWGKFLKAAGHSVSIFPDLGLDNYDLCIHSNTINQSIKAKKHFLWCGSFHCGNYSIDKADLIICSQNIKDRFGWGKAKVINAPFDIDIFKYKSNSYVGRKIICNSNPNRHLNHTLTICRLLDQAVVDYRFYISGGNRLYSDKFGDDFSFNVHPKITYLGLLSRESMIQEVASSHLWVYPHLSRVDETFCVAAMEAAALGLTCIMPKLEPFTYLYPNAIFCSNELEFADAIKYHITQTRGNNIDVSEFRSDYIFPLLEKEILKLVGGKDEV